MSSAAHSIKPNKKCGLCNKKNMLMDCKYCRLNFCLKCLIPELHKCANISNCQEMQRDALKITLEKNKSETSHNFIK